VTSPEQVDSTQAATRKSTRIVGLDIARAFAIVGMVFVNFKITMGADGGSQWLRSFSAMFDGRAAATFVVLAGIGASLGSRRARESDDAGQRHAARITLAKRALFLFVLGWAFYQVWPADILHYYGIYLACGAVVLFASSRQLLWLAAGAISVATVFIVLFDPFRNWDLVDYSYNGISTPSGFARNLLFDGFHPVFPWVAFYFFGMWLGRTDLRNRAWRKKLAIRAGVIVIASEVAAWVLLGPKGASLDDLDDESWRWLFSVEPIPPLPLYMAAGGATAVLVIIGSIWIGENVRDALVEPLVSTGQLALTIYVAHVIVGMGVLEGMGRLEHQSLEWAVLTSVVMSASAILFSWLWRRKYARGPVEWTMRRIAG